VSILFEDPFYHKFLLFRGQPLLELMAGSMFVAPFSRSRSVARGIPYAVATALSLVWTPVFGSQIASAIAVSLGSIVNR
jgi:hypothetical protein